MSKELLKKLRLGLISFAAIGLLASVGVRMVEVATRPRIVLLISGDEFVVGTAPQPGKIFGSNGVMLQAALRAAGLDADVHQVGDDREALIHAWIGGKPVFGLPGNPRAVMVLFHEYVLPFLRAMQGAAQPWMRSDRLPITASVQLKGNRSEFRAAKVTGGKVELLADEGSHMLLSLAEANALAFIPADVRDLKIGELIEVHYIH